ncbi:MAG TPA: OmpA family protein [Polyangiaceae bacterium]|jgi:chemotaxis protein MotB|nr:OmpA family protein [Polyangiaceae bacterium]
MAPLRSSFVLAAAVSIGSASSLGCVSKIIYDREVADAAKAQADSDAKHKDDAAQIQTLLQQVSAAEATTQDRDSKLNDLSTTSHNLQAQLDEATAINQQLRGELERLGKDVDKVLADRGTLSKALDDAKARLDELRKAQAAAESRTQLFQDLGRRFQALVAAGQLRVESRGNRLVVNVKGDLLFDAGRAELRGAGKGALMEVARALETAPPGQARHFLVTASVDDEPVKSKHFESSWDLTTARAVTVVKYLVSLGVPAGSLTAAGAGSFDPLGPNDSTEARAKNRRVEIGLLPGSEEPGSSASPSSAGATLPAPQATK